jgi:hypothetical protein
MSVSYSIGRGRGGGGRRAGRDQKNSVMNLARSEIVATFTVARKGELEWPPSPCPSSALTNPTRKASHVSLWRRKY